MRLADRTGTFRGTNGFRLMPADPLAEGPATATLTGGGRSGLTTLSYTWVHPDDGGQEGTLAFGQADTDDADDTAVIALWGDSWHQQPAARAFTGTASDDGIELAAEYGGGWAWRIGLHAVDGGLVLRMDNVIPADRDPAGPYVVMQMELAAT